jgi:hypothetical protein
MSPGGDGHRAKRDIGPTDRRRTPVDGGPPARVEGVGKHDEPRRRGNDVEHHAVWRQAKDAARSNEAGAGVLQGTLCKQDLPARVEVVSGQDLERPAPLGNP